jgi:hypothetical protein
LRDSIHRAPAARDQKIVRLIAAAITGARAVAPTESPCSWTRSKPPTMPGTNPPANLEPVLRGESFDRSAWTLANLHLG